MKKYLYVLLSSILAGCFITCGATVYLVCTNLTRLACAIYLISNWSSSILKFKSIK